VVLISRHAALGDAGGRGFGIFMIAIAGYVAAGAFFVGAILKLVLPGEHRPLGGAGDGTRHGVPRGAGAADAGTAGPLAAAGSDGPGAADDHGNHAHPAGADSPQAPHQSGLAGAGSCYNSLVRQRIVIIEDEADIVEMIRLQFPQGGI